MEGVRDGVAVRRLKPAALWVLNAFSLEMLPEEGQGGLLASYRNKPGERRNPKLIRMDTHSMIMIS
jgi:hypothetical protein